ncbi:MAG: hypothetical protein HY514_04675 [Candidatus Aenigmarchaeota archaeon]|nr:hypothetical protein [Candidatus Aenigmarchaeota archaeon]
MLGIMIGIALTISAIGIISAVSVSYAHGRDANNMIASGMVSGDMMPMMHSMMMDGNAMDGNDMMGCMSMMKNHGEMTQEEIDEMLKSMDKDGDGLCDYCSMSIEACRRMMGS